MGDYIIHEIYTKKSFLKIKQAFEINKIQLAFVEMDERVTIHSRFEGTINRAELQHRFIPDILMWVQGGDTEKISVTE